MFGKNLKKIRSVHGMSQQEFAELFDLKRATLGAYEEDRSNPKLETVVKIANHFSIGIEDLLTKELTVNRLLRFNEAITTANESTEPEGFAGIFCITPETKARFIAEFTDANTISNGVLPQIQLPNAGGGNKLALVIDDLTMSGGTSGFLPKDIVIGTAVPLKDIATATGQLVFVITEKEIYFRHISYQGDKAVLQANHPGVESVALNTAEIKGIWRIVHVFRYTLPTGEGELETAPGTTGKHIICPAAKTGMVK